MGRHWDYYPNNKNIDRCKLCDRTIIADEWVEHMNKYHHASFTKEYRDLGT